MKYTLFFLMLGYSAICFCPQGVVTDNDLIIQLNSFMDKMDEKRKPNAIVTYQKIITRINEKMYHYKNIENVLNNLDKERKTEVEIQMLFQKLESIEDLINSFENAKARFKSKYYWIKDYEKPYKD
jgi:hypothetical protein